MQRCEQLEEPITGTWFVCWVSVLRTLKGFWFYEYMSNGSLADLLFRVIWHPDWNDRLRIALDVARGILYLHEECEAPVIHCDIKSQKYFDG